MSIPHLFEFMDLKWLPGGLRTTLREILECVCSPPFRCYYRWAAQTAEQAIAEGGFSQVVELGAGTAPITRHLARRLRSKGSRICLVPCDSNPDVPCYRVLQRQYPEMVRPIYEPSDLCDGRSWPPRTLLILSATLHHVPPADRVQVLDKLLRSADGLIVFEPLRKKWSSVVLVCMSPIPGLLLPLLWPVRHGRLRRMLWCWMIPLAPFMFAWDGIVSCLRQWTKSQWQSPRSLLGGAEVQEHILCQSIIWRRMASATATEAEIAQKSTEEFPKNKVLSTQVC